MKENIDHVVYTNKALCRDCNRCVRVCPVNAIKIENSQAQVIQEKCIDCGACVLECPQNAKSYLSDIDKVQKLIDSRETTAVSMAPSFASVFLPWQRSTIPSALRMLGFSHIAETAVGAYYSSMESRKYIEQNPNQSHICTACPAVVGYVEKYKPQLINRLIPVVSPMIAHARSLKKKLPHHKLVFIGPCIAKIKEIKRPEFAGEVEAAITFDELNQLFINNNIVLENCEESSFDEIPNGDSRLFPIEGGLLKTAGLSTDILDNNQLCISGPKEVQEALNLIIDNPEPLVIEPLYCKHGCINGPAVPQERNNYRDRKEILNYNGEKSVGISADYKAEANLKTHFKKDIPHYQRAFSEAEIREVLVVTGKENPDHELDCGGCGYNTCREKAIAVLQGIAEVEMCIPHMRRIAENRSHLIIEKDPNGIVLLDDKLRIKHMNPAFKKMFFCSDKVVGQPISYLVDASPFERVLSDQDSVIREELRIPGYNLVCHQFCYSIPEEGSLVGVFVDVTEFQHSQRKLNKIKTDTIIQAHELIEHQIKMAQEQAKFLGENTAKGEMLLQKLIDAIEK